LRQPPESLHGLAESLDLFVEFLLQNRLVPRNSFLSESTSQRITFDDPQGTFLTSPLRPRIISVNSPSLPTESLMS
jgi:hypothetical protein